MDFDPYKQWLQIDDTSPNHYQLLGIPVFTTDLDEIRAAYANRYEAVHPYQAGKLGPVAQRVIDELSLALRCLTDVQSKRRYDNDLRQDMASRETVLVSDGEEAAVTAPIHFLDAVEEENGTLPPPLEELREPPQPTTPTVEPVKHAGVSPALPITLFVVGLVVISALAIGIGSSARHVGDAALSTGTVTTLASAAASASNQPSDLGITGNGRPSQTNGTNGRPTEGEARVVTRDVVEWRGKLLKMLVSAEGIEPPRLHLLLQGAEMFEATTTDEALIEQALGCVTASASEELACELRVRGARASSQRRFFEPKAATEVLALESLEVLTGSYETPEAVTDEHRRMLRGLRTVGSYVRFTGTIKRLFTDNRLLVTVADREYCVPLPAAWRAMHGDLATGEELALVTRTTAEFSVVDNDSARPTVPLLQAETVGQPDFDDVTRNPSPYLGQTLCYHAKVLSSLMEGDLGTAVLTLQNEGRSHQVSASAVMTSAQQDFVDELDWRQSVLVELQIVGEKSPPAFELIAFTYLDEPSRRVAFTAGSKTEGASEPSVLAASGSHAPPIGGVFSDVPFAVELPVFPSSGAALLVLQRPPARALAVEVDSSVCDFGPTRQIVAKPVEHDPARWLLALQQRSLAHTQEVVLAHLALQDKSLLFSWQTEAPVADAGQLRNCFLRLTTDDETHVLALRTPVAPVNNRLPQASLGYRAPLNLTDLPAARSLRVDVQVRYERSESTSPQGPTATTGKKLDFPLEGFVDGKVEVEVVLVSNRDGGLALQAAPHYRISPTSTIRVSPQEFAAKQRRLEITRAKTNASRIRARDLRKRQTLDSKIYQIDQTLRTLKTFTDRDLHDLQTRTRIHYQIYAQAGARKLVLVDAGYSRAHR